MPTTLDRCGPSHYRAPREGDDASVVTADPLWGDIAVTVAVLVVWIGALALFVLWS